MAQGLSLDHTLVQDARAFEQVECVFDWASLCSSKPGKFEP